MSLERKIIKVCQTRICETLTLSSHRSRRGGKDHTTGCFPMWTRHFSKSAPKCSNVDKILSFPKNRKRRFTMSPSFLLDIVLCFVFRTRKRNSFKMFLEGFWDCGRVCGDRSVFVTSHRPAHFSRAYASSLFKLCISHLKCFCLPHLPPLAPPCLWIWSLQKFLDEFSVPEAFRTKLVDSACLKVWQFAEHVDDVKDWTGILSSLEPPIVDRMHIASVRFAYKAACARDAELLSRGRDYPGEDTDAPLESREKAYVDRGAGQALPLPASIVTATIRYATLQVGP